MRYFIVKNSGVLNLASLVDDSLEGDSLDAALALIDPAVTPSDWTEINESDIPTASNGDGFFDAFDYDGSTITEDFDKVKEIYIDSFRLERNEKLQSADIKFQIALEQDDSDEKTRIADYKQRLRDLTTDDEFNSATTTEELIQIRPSILDEEL